MSKRYTVRYMPTATLRCDRYQVMDTQTSVTFSTGGRGLAIVSLHGTNKAAALAARKLNKAA
jgi:hypothetical protein